MAWPQGLLPHAIFALLLTATVCYGALDFTSSTPNDLTTHLGLVDGGIVFGNLNDDFCPDVIVNKALFGSPPYTRVYECVPNATPQGVTYVDRTATWLPEIAAATATGCSGGSDGRDDDDDDDDDGDDEDGGSGCGLLTCKGCDSPVMQHCDHPQSVVVADVNSDGLHDIIINHAREVLVFVNRGSAASPVFYVDYNINVNARPRAPFNQTIQYLRVPSMFTRGLGVMHLDATPVRDRMTLDIIADNNDRPLVASMQYTYGVWHDNTNGDKIDGIGTSPEMIKRDSEYLVVADMDSDGNTDIGLRSRNRRNVYYADPFPADPNGHLLSYSYEPEISGQARDTTHQASVCACDFRNSGYMDYLWLGHDTSSGNRNTHIYRHEVSGGGIVQPRAFERVSITGTIPHTISPVERQDWISCACDDLNNDGWVDFVLGGRENSAIFINQYNPVGDVYSFEAFTFPSLAGHVGQSIATADVNHDGFIDIVYSLGSLCKQDCPALYINDRNNDNEDGYSCMFRVRFYQDEGTTDLTDLIGAQVELYDTSMTRLGTREISGGSGAGSQGFHVVHFGLGNLDPSKEALIALIRPPCAQPPVYHLICPGQHTSLIESNKTHIIELFYNSTHERYDDKLCSLKNDTYYSTPGTTEELDVLSNDRFGYVSPMLLDASTLGVGAGCTDPGCLSTDPAVSDSITVIGGRGTQRLEYQVDPTAEDGDIDDFSYLVCLAPPLDGLCGFAHVRMIILDQQYALPPSPCLPHDPAGPAMIYNGCGPVTIGDPGAQACPDDPLQGSSVALPDVEIDGSTPPDVASDDDDDFDGYFCSFIDVQDLGPFTGVELTVEWDHTYVGDLSVWLFGPNEAYLPLMFRPQGGAATNPPSSGCPCGDSSNVCTGGTGMSSTWVWKPTGAVEPETLGSGLGGNDCIGDQLDLAVSTDQAVAMPGGIIPCLGTAPVDLTSWNCLGTPLGRWWMCVGDHANVDEGQVNAWRLNFVGANCTDLDYLWSPGGETTPTITVEPLVTTIYEVTVTNHELNCTVEDATVVIVQPCDDGNPCNGVETCNATFCVPGPSGLGETCTPDPGTEDLCFLDYVCVLGDVCAPLTNGTVRNCTEEVGLPPGTCAMSMCDSVKGCVTTWMDEECEQPENPCQIAYCDDVTHLCVVEDREDGDWCNDGRICTSDDQCVSGECIGTPLAVLCAAPPNECQTVSCNATAVPGEECIYADVANGTPCELGLLDCTIGKTCQSGLCTGGSPRDCNDFNMCTSETCVEPGGCVYTPLANGTACGAVSGNLCYPNSTCLLGECVVDTSGAGLDCDDSIDCTIDLCSLDEGGECVHIADDTACPVSLDPCFEVFCNVNSAPGTGCHARVRHLANCDDGNACSHNDRCNAIGDCVGEPLDFLCPDIAGGCQVGFCNMILGGCEYSAVADGTACSDGDACTVNDTCTNGACVPGSPRVCPVVNDCFDNVCDSDFGCMLSIDPVGEPCTPVEATPCLSDYECNGGGQCQAQAAVPCDDGIACTEDECHWLTGNCTYTPVDELCPPSGEQCRVNVCVGGIGCVLTDVDYGTPCFSGNPCTTNDICDGVGECVGTPQDELCPNPSPCVESVCSIASGGCVDQNVPDDEPCVTGKVQCMLDMTCQSGVCSGGVAAVCDNGNPCESSVCDENVGCVYSVMVNQTCTPTPGLESQCFLSYKCSQEGACLPITNGLDLLLRDCDDGKACTLDTCDEIYGCKNTADNEGCALGQPVDPCIRYVCNPTTGDCESEFMPIGTPCDDGYDCTIGDTCNAGVCSGVANDILCVPEVCGGYCNHCEIPRCLPVDLLSNATTGCQLQFEPDDTPCVDMDDLCQVNTTCQSGVCTDGAPRHCFAESACVSSTCLPLFGCTVTANTSANGQPCGIVSGGVCFSGSATCDDGICVVSGGGQQTPCDDQRTCTTEFCDINGLCQSFANDTFCELELANDPLIVQGCYEATCNVGHILSNTTTGCVVLPQGSTVPCDDGRFCTQNDRCNGAGGCQGTPVDGLCPQGTTCQAGVCNATSATPGEQCILVNANDFAICDEIATECLLNPTCLNGVCQGGFDVSPFCNDQNDCTNDICVPQIWGCTHFSLPPGASCAVSSGALGECLTESACSVGGTCLPNYDGAHINCTDAHACTQDLCSQADSCFHIGNDTLCSSLSTIFDDACIHRACDTASGCIVELLDETHACATGIDCAVGYCTGGYCQATAQHELCVDDLVDERCQVAVCEVPGGCAAVNITNGTPCDANPGDDPCIVGRVCTNGLCGGGHARDCDDANQCTVDTCNSTATFAEACQHTIAADATPCGATPPGSSLCYQDSACFLGVCQPNLNGTVLDCSHLDNDCTRGVCFEGTGCVHQTNVSACPPTIDPCIEPLCHETLGCLVAFTSNACDDGFSCTLDDVCSGVGLECDGTPVDAMCPPLDPVTEQCVVAVCDPAAYGGSTGCGLVPIADGTPCDDFNVCTTGDECSAGVCVGGAALPAPIPYLLDPCHDASCDPVNGWLYTVNDGATCHFFSPLEPDVCWSNATCTAAGECALNVDSIDEECQDNFECTLHTCELLGGCQVELNHTQCVVEAGSEHPNFPCTRRTCDELLGCIDEHAPVGTFCDDGLDCTLDDHCDAGVCIGTPVHNQCPTPTNECLQPFCNVAPVNPLNLTLGCNEVPVEDGVSCSEGTTACFVGKFCSAGTCAGGLNVSCGTLDSCKEYYCDDVAGCLWNATNIGAPCVRTMGTEHLCFLNGTCSEYGNCEVTILPPEEQNSTNTVQCDDGHDCTRDECDSVGACVHTPIEHRCNSTLGNPCLSEYCHESFDCVVTVLTGAACSTGIPCEVDGTCTIAGLCVGTPSDVLCPQGNQCQVGVCDPLLPGGCALLNTTGAACDDNDACTENDVCNGSVCAGTPIDVNTVCDTGNPCNAKICHPAVGCVVQALPDETPCIFASNVTVDECFMDATCLGGVCYPVNGTNAVVCDDGFTCTDDWCNSATGCDATRYDNLCGTHPNYPCTEYVCDPGHAGANATTGCYEVVTVAPCVDGISCTTDSECANGDCIGIPHDALCPDYEGGCVLGLCDALAGCYNDTQPDGTSCTPEVNDVCMLAAVCQAGMCVQTIPLDCDDGNPCTNSTCDPGAGGCVHPGLPVNTPCHLSVNESRHMCWPNATCSGPGGGNICQPDPELGTIDCPIVATCEDVWCDSTRGCVKEANHTFCGAPADGYPPDLPCTWYACDPDSINADPITGCVVTQLQDFTACNDGINCTLNDHCEAGECVGNPSDLFCAPEDTPLIHEDHAQCWYGTCVQGSGCIYDLLPDGRDCIDHSVCTVNDTCIGGLCIAGPSLDCQAILLGENPYLTDTCITAECIDPLGCLLTLVADDTPCAANASSTGDLCFVTHACNQGSCDPVTSGGITQSCATSFECLDDFCDSTRGCLSEENSSKCPVHPSHPCVQWLCDPTHPSANMTTGCYETNVDLIGCDDGDACTDLELCLNGECTSHHSIVCPTTPNSCTQYVCHDVGGVADCQLENTDLICDDGNPCTHTDRCTDGTCIGTPIECDDGNQCTDDFCDARGSGVCEHVPHNRACKLEDPCFHNAACDPDLVCCLGQLKDCDDGNDRTFDFCEPVQPDGVCRHVVLDRQGNMLVLDPGETLPESFAFLTVNAVESTPEDDDHEDVYLFVFAPTYLLIIVLVTVFLFLYFRSRINLLRDQIVSRASSLGQSEQTGQARAAPTIYRSVPPQYDPYLGNATVPRQRQQSGNAHHYY